MEAGHCLPQEISGGEGESGAWRYPGKKALMSGGRGPRRSLSLEWRRDARRPAGPCQREHNLPQVPWFVPLVVTLCLQASRRAAVWRGQAFGLQGAGVGIEETGICSFPFLQQCWARSCELLRRLWGCAAGRRLSLRWALAFPC